MAIYSPRVEAPSTTNKNFIHTSFKGYNKCIIINNKTGSVLSNCVGYSWGRWREILGYAPRLSKGNAEDWWGNTTDGYKRGQTPKLGAVMCWKKGQTWNGNDGYGHVAIVEEIKSNGDVIVSESMYGSVRWRRHTYTKTSNYYLGSGYVFQGFIYLPIDFEEPKITTTYKTGEYKVNTNLLNVRKGPGTNYAALPYKKFTLNAQKQIYSLVKYKPNYYVKGVVCTVLKVQDNWGKTPSGWICLDYCIKN
jgi:surface antigen